MGYNATVTNRGECICDTCSGVKRDKNGYAWFPGETSHTYVEIATGKEVTVTRKEAFA